MSMVGAEPAAQELLQEHDAQKNGVASTARSAGATELARRETELAEQWLTREVLTEMKAKNLVAFDSEPHGHDFTRKLIKARLETFYNLNNSKA